MISRNIKDRWQSIRQKSQMDYYLVTLIYVLSSFALAVRSAVQNTDTWLLLLFGKYIYDFGKIPDRVMFVLGYANKPYIYHEWLTELTMFINYHYFGETGIRLVRGLLVATFFLFALKIIRAKTSSTLTQILLFPVLYYPLRGFMTDRPYLISLMFFTLIFYLLTKYLEKGKKRYLAFIPALNLLWGNLHAEWMLGGLLLATYLIGVTIDKGWGSPSRHLSLTLITFPLAALITPYGWHVFWQAGKIISATAYVDELKHVIWPRDNGFIILFITVILVKLSMSITRKKRNFTEWLPLLIFSLLGINFSRYMIYAIPLLVFAVTENTDTIIKRMHPIPRQQILSMALVLVMAFFAVLSAFYLEPVENFYYKAAVGELVKQIPHGKKTVLYIPWNLSDYALFQYNSNQWDFSLQVIQDTRAEIYQKERWEDSRHLDLIGGPYALKALDKYQVDFIIVKEDNPLLTDLLGNPKFEPVNYKEDFFLFKGLPNKK